MVFHMANKPMTIHPVREPVINPDAHKFSIVINAISVAICTAINRIFNVPLNSTAHIWNPPAAIAPMMSAIDGLSYSVSSDAGNAIMWQNAINISLGSESENQNNAFAFCNALFITSFF